jgi:ankyrin repeat protein
MALATRSTNHNMAMNCFIDCGNFELAQKLIESSITSEARYCGDVNAQNTRGLTSLHKASENGALEVVRLLLEHGADVEAKNNDGRTALEVVRGTNHDKIVKLLREHGANFLSIYRDTTATFLLVHSL